ncbi:hypothetical protein NP493_222g07008 [Ridgeia piscesae]|uniref:Secreted protein n=1 Tax=Ridgeia piscesae TaxID=27915 RepID=A0AAD9P0E1_RIDPI|nr:hypothetical protein NP493_222g07008 [Ridgeia piscesae]
MSSLAGPAPWRCHATILIVLTSLILRSPADSVGEQTTFNAALYQRVTVSPPDATCGRGDRVTYSRSHTVQCLSGCPGRNFSTLARPDTRFPAAVYEMGGEACHMMENSYDKLQPVMCYLFFRARYSERYTYSVWVKPTDTQTEQ